MSPRGVLSGLGYTPILVGVLLSAGRDAVAQNSCVTAQCHATLLTKNDVHPPSESCDSCHESVATPHPQEKTKTFKLTSDPPELCYACHDALGEKGDVHPPVKEGMCTACHDPHASNEPKLLVNPEKETCLGCHETIVTQAMTVLHGPIKDGKCTACHDPHGSPNGKLLVKEFPPGPYAPYTDQEYALCFSCHERDLVQAPDTSSATGFRDGERNLHYVHVNKAQKGRSCVLCHDVHGGKSPKLIADSVPFGTWSLPLKFAKTETGGSCAPGCHKPQSYDRQSHGKKPQTPKPAAPPPAKANPTQG
jgi:predicted CXXCH cytochrome family protein